MSRIKGYYMCGGSRRDRWLDTGTGELYLYEYGGCPLTHPFKAQPTGVWSFNSSTFFPDMLPVANWYVLRFIPEGVFAGEKRNASTITTGPYTEAEARIQAVNWTEQTRSRTCKVAMVQLIAGNTLTREQPPAPAPMLVWS